MRHKDDVFARLGREAVGMGLEVGLTLAMMAIALLIAVLATRGRF